MSVADNREAPGPVLGEHFGAGIYKQIEAFLAGVSADGENERFASNARDRLLWRKDRIMNDRDLSSEKARIILDVTWKLHGYCVGEGKQQEVQVPLRSPYVVVEREGIPLRAYDAYAPSNCGQQEPRKNAVVEAHNSVTGARRKQRLSDPSDQRQPLTEADRRMRLGASHAVPRHALVDVVESLRIGIVESNQNHL